MRSSFAPLLVTSEATVYFSGAVLTSALVCFRRWAHACVFCLYLYIWKHHADDKVAGPVAAAGQSDGRRSRSLTEELGDDEPRDGPGPDFKEAHEEEDGRHADVAHPRVFVLDGERTIGQGQQQFGNARACDRRVRALQVEHWVFFRRRISRKKTILMIWKSRNNTHITHWKNVMSESVSMEKLTSSIIYNTTEHTTAGHRSRCFFKHDTTHLIDELIHLNSLILLFSLAWKPIQFHVHAYAHTTYLPSSMHFVSLNKKLIKKAHTHAHAHMYTCILFLFVTFFSILWLYDVLSTVLSSSRCYVYVLSFVL